MSPTEYILAGAAAAVAVIHISCHLQARRLDRQLKRLQALQTALILVDSTNAVAVACLEQDKTLHIPDGGHTMNEVVQSSMN